ncbi:hypothetical protein DA803_02540 [[Mycoplasma] phocae]|uniref:Lipoprotein n=1 Tax=[Mycoplasma] phocae TaxID=142651 RepID=A0A2Z5IQE8_9BACT|nr:hypothetical protein [[Mycoplasma] phocae]AXE60949.1 hypothetical protein DA803_02540 [[Mycoplasma] phocae]
MKKKNFKWWIALPVAITSIPLIAAACNKKKDSNDAKDGETQTPPKPTPDQTPQPKPDLKPDSNPAPAPQPNPDLNPAPAPKPEIIDALIIVPAFNIKAEFIKKFDRLDEMKKLIDEFHNLFYSNNSKTDIETDKYKWLKTDLELARSSENTKAVADQLSLRIKEDEQKIISSFHKKIRELQEVFKDDISYTYNRILSKGKISKELFEAYKKEVENYLKIESTLEEIYKKFPTYKLEIFKDVEWLTKFYELQKEQMKTIMSAKSMKMKS